jgi:hypothetical protein
MTQENNTGTSNSLYDYEFSVRESEPKRAEMLNRLKDRVKHVDKKEVISSDEYVEGETNFSEDKALSAFLLYKLFPSKAQLLKDHYTKDQVDGLLGDLIAKYYLKDQIDSMLNNLKNELKSSLDDSNGGIGKKLNDLKTELSKHRTLEELDHPDASVTTRKLRDHSVTKEKLSASLTNELNAKLNKNGDTVTGVLKFAYNNSILFETGPGTGKYHRIGFGSTLEEIGRGEAHLDLGDYDGNTYETNLCCVNRPGWFNATTKEVKKFALQEEIDALNNRVNNLPRGGGSTTFAKISANKIWSGRVTVRNSRGSRSKPKFKVCDLPANWDQIIIYSSIQQRASDNDDGWYNYMTNCFAILIKGIAADVIAGYQGIQEVKSFFVEGNTLYMRGLTPNGDDISVFNL